MKLSTAPRMDEQINAARRHLAACRPHLAGKLVWRVLQAQPGHVRARLLMAEAMLRTDQPTEALHHLDVADAYLRNESRGAGRAAAVRQLLLRGAALERSGRTREAIEAWRAAIGLDPTCVAAMRCLAAALMNIEEHGSALRVVERLIALRPTDEAAVRAMIDASEALGRHDQAIEGIYRLARLRAGRTGRSGGRLRRSDGLRLARLLHRAGRFADAFALYCRLSAAVPGDADLACEWAELAAAMGDERWAGRLLAAALQTDPRHGRAATMAAEQQMRVGRFLEAGRRWWRLHQQDRSAVRPLAHLLVCAIESMRHTLVERVEARLTATAPADQRRAAVADAWRVALPGEALSDLLTGPQRADDATVLGGLLSEAVTTFEQTVPEHAGYADLHYHLAVCHDALGERAGAAECLDRALHINPGYVDAACRRARLLLEEGHADAAAAVIAVAAERQPNDPRLRAITDRIAGNRAA